jgi:hypothetical protein
MNELRKMCTLSVDSVSAPDFMKSQPFYSLVLNNTHLIMRIVLSFIMFFICHYLSVYKKNFSLNSHCAFSRRRHVM